MPPQEPNGLLLFGLCFLAAAALIGLFKLNHWLHTRSPTPRHYVASADQPSPQKADTKAVHVPVPAPPPTPGTGRSMLDITEDEDLPRVGRRLSDDSIIAVLATQKGEDGAKYRFSANQIYDLVKGPRADVLAQVKAIRDGPPAPYVREHQDRLEQLHSEEHAAVIR